MLTSRRKIIDTVRGREFRLTLRLRLGLPAKATMALATTLGFQAAHAFGVVPDGHGYGLGCALSAGAILAADVFRSGSE